MQWVVIRFVEFGVEGALHSDIPELLITGSSYRARREQNVIRVARPCPPAVLPAFRTTSNHRITAEPDRSRGQAAIRQFPIIDIALPVPRWREKRMKLRLGLTAILGAEIVEPI
jgi:hypothetical protein